MSSTDHLSELESLRSQVAELVRELAERDQSMRAQNHQFEVTMQDLREQSHLLRTIVEGPAAETGDDFFASLVTHLTSMLHVQYAVIGEVCEGRHKKIRTLAVSAGGTLVDNFEYELAHTPCATALTETFACIDRDVQARFPQFRRLADLGAEGYCGVSLRTKGGAVIGLLIVMDTKPLQQGDYLQSLLGVLAPRVVAEFERRRADQERAQALADLHNVMETVPDVMFTLDTQGNMVKWNRRAVDVTGYSPEELLNKPALAFVPPEEQTRTTAAIQRAFMEGYAELDGHLLTKEHRLIPYHWTGALLKNPQGEPIGITGVGRDVSGKKRTEEELRQQRCHLVDAQALAHLGSWDWDLDTGEVEWSDEQFRIFGYEPGAIAVTHDSFLASLHPDDHAPVLAAINDALLGKRPCDVECRIVRPNGEVRSIDVRGDVNRDATGHPLSMAGIALDITERKQFEATLRASEERWQLAVRGSNDGIWDWNIQAGDIFFSPRWKAMRGFEDHEITNHVDEWRNRIHPDDLDRVLQSIDAYLAKQAPEFCEEYRVQKKGSSYMWVLGQGVALWDKQGTAVRMAGSETDITERKRAEEQRDRQYEQLQTMYRITVALTQARAVEELYAEALNGICSVLNADRASILLFDEDGVMRFQASRGLSERYQHAVEGHSPWSREAVNPPPICVPDVAEAPSMEAYRDIFRAEGIRALVFIPLVSFEGLLGKFMLYYDTPHQFTDEDIRVAHTIASHVAFMIQRKRAEDEHHRLLVELAQSQKHFERLFHLTPSAIAISTVAEGRFLEVNDALVKLTGYAREELIGRTTLELKLWVDPPERVRAIQEIRQKGFVHNKEGLLRTKSGEHRHIMISAEPMQVEADACLIYIAHDITAWKQAEMTRAQLAAIVESSNDAIIGLSLDGAILSWNRGADAMFGYGAGEILGQSIAALYPPAGFPEADELMQRLARGSRGDHFETMNRHRQGHAIAVSVSVAPILDGSGRLIGISHIVRDITERKRAEEALRESEQRLGAILTNSPNMIFLKDLDGRYLYANKVFSDWLHLDPQVVIGKTDADLFEPDQARRFRQHDQQVVQEGTAHSFEEIALHADGQHTSIVVKFPLTDSAGQIYATGGVATDITTRKRAEDAIREAELRYRTIFEQAGAGVAQVESRTGQFVQVNRQYCEILGLTEAEMLGNTVGAITHPDDLERDLESMKRLLSGEISSFTLEKRYVRKDGSIVWVNLNVAPLWWPGEPPVHHIAIVQDITDRKRMEEALRQRERDLRAAVEERERISQDLHDGILQSLFAVGLTLETTKSMMSPRTRKTSGAPLDQAIDQLNRVMHEIRNFIAGLGSDLLKGMDLPTALQHMLDSLTQTQATRVRLAVEDRAAQAVSVEQSMHLLLVIQEAVSNCIRHGHAHEATVSLKMLKQGVRLSVRDNGSGFNPKAATGVGHGLANMAARAQKLGGRFTVFSKINEGTRVVFDLPKEASYASRQD